MPLVQDGSIDLLTSSLVSYHCATDAPSDPKNIIGRVYYWYINRQDII